MGLMGLIDILFVMVINFLLNVGKIIIIIVTIGTILFLMLFIALAIYGVVFLR